jgi:hypothetical protein
MMVKETNFNHQKCLSPNWLLTLRGGRPEKPFHMKQWKNKTKENCEFLWESSCDYVNVRCQMSLASAVMRT